MRAMEETELWRRSLGATGGSEQEERFRARLTAALASLRERAKLLGGEIASDHPDFPVHDVSHSDALWGLADRIAGPEAALNPAEAFVFGAAALVHDLGMAAAAYVDGADSLRDDPRWHDRVAWALRHAEGRPPRPDEVADPSPEVALAATASLLRELHAERAERLMSATWTDSKERTYKLLEDDGLRETFGPTIGLMAHSHWWSVTAVGERFSRRLGAPAGCPAEWTTDPLPIACLLRLADASHLDASRAPRFLAALRNPTGVAAEHWEFQAHLAQPFVEKDRFVFTGTAFGIDEADAWWRCADTLRAVDREFRAVDALLADRAEGRFQVRGVAGTESFERLAERIPTSGWSPADARLQVSDVVRLVERMGGRALYGDRPDVPLRELVQNASDAVRAQREIEGLGDDWGTVTVRLGEPDGQGTRWLEVEDTGVGMSTEMLSTHLLDFGRSFWDSEQVLKEMPGLLSKGFVPTGRFGIGFFSVFMWGGDVRVTSWRHGESKADTRVLEFSGGLSRRPLLRPAATAEQLGHPGTRVGVELGDEVLDRLGVGKDAEAPSALARLCAWLAPALDVDLVTECAGSGPKTAVTGGDWRGLGMDRLARRLEAPPPVAAAASAQGKRKRNHDENLRDLRSADGTLVGRALLDPGGTNPGAVAVGGLWATAANNIGGILLGDPVSVSRHSGLPLVSAEVLSAWASEQAALLTPQVEGAEALVAADLVFFCGGDPGSLPITLTREGPLNKAEAADWIAGRDEVIAVLDVGEVIARAKRGELELSEGCATIMAGPGSSLLDHGPGDAPAKWDDWPSSMFEPRISGLGPLVDLVEKSWGATFDALAKGLVDPSDPSQPGDPVKGMGFRLRRPT